MLIKTGQVKVQPGGLFDKQGLVPQNPISANPDTVGLLF